MTQLRTFIDRRNLRDGIRNADLDHNFQYLEELAQGVLPGIPDSRPILLVVTGQSNSGPGIGNLTTPVVVNDRVFDWSAARAGQTATHGWIVQDLNATEYPDYDVGEVYTGVIRGNRGHPGWGCANSIQMITGRDVYMVCVYKSGTAIAEWLPGGGVESVLEQRVAEAVASPELVAEGIDYADVLVWGQGESDGQRLVSEYVADFNTMRDSFEASGWVINRQTQWYLTQTPAQDGSYFANANTFVEALDNENDEWVRAIRTDRMIPHDNLHFDGDDAIRIGIYCVCLLVCRLWFSK
jgi:hypothetical protein